MAAPLSRLSAGPAALRSWGLHCSLLLFLLLPALLNSGYKENSTKPACGQPWWSEDLDVTRHWPWEVSLRLENEHVCGGALIDFSWVVTAAHCIQGTKEYSVILGTSKLKPMDPTKSVSIPVRDIIMHPKYWGRTFTMGDVALLLLHTPVVFKSLFQGCGQTSVSCKVVKGQLVEVGKWPWQVSLLFLGVYICSGSLVHHQWILTAAHCLQRSMNPKDYVVMVGVQHLPENGTQLPLARIVIHENFSNLISNDIALLKLRDPVFWSPLIQPVCLPTAKVKLPIGTMCWVVGWGNTKSPVTSKTPYSLQEVAVKIVNKGVCNQQYQFLYLKGQKKFIGNDVLCANSEWGIDTCQDNSGSSMVCQVNKTWMQMGVVSWNFSCKKHRFPGIYTSTSYFTHWIRKRIADVKFISRAHLTFLNPVLLTGYILLVSLGPLWLL